MLEHNALNVSMRDDYMPGHYESKFQKILQIWDPGGSKIIVVPYLSDSAVADIFSLSMRIAAKRRACQ
ncbi:hypothetical protein ACFL4W_05560 [Planctomycetota bacterium]